MQHPKRDQTSALNNIKQRIPPADLQSIAHWLTYLLEDTKNRLVSSPIAAVPTLQGEAQAYQKVIHHLTRTSTSDVS